MYKRQTERDPFVINAKQCNVSPLRTHKPGLF